MLVKFLTLLFDFSLVNKEDYRISGRLLWGRWKFGTGKCRTIGPIMSRTKDQNCSTGKCGITFSTSAFCGEVGPSFSRHVGRSLICLVPHFPVLLVISLPKWACRWPGCFRKRGWLAVLQHELLLCCKSTTASRAQRAGRTIRTRRRMEQYCVRNTRRWTRASTPADSRWPTAWPRSGATFPAAVSSSTTSTASTAATPLPVSTCITWAPHASRQVSSSNYIAFDAYVPICLTDSLSAVDYLQVNKRF